MDLYYPEFVAACDIGISLSPSWPLLHRSKNFQGVKIPSKPGQAYYPRTTKCSALPFCSHQRWPTPSCYAVITYPGLSAHDAIGW